MSSNNSYGPMLFVGLTAAAGAYCLYQGYQGVRSVFNGMNFSSCADGIGLGSANETPRRATRAAQAQIANQTTTTTSTTAVANQTTATPSTTAVTNQTTATPSTMPKKSVVHLRPSTSNSPDFNRSTLNATAMRSVQDASLQLSASSNSSNDMVLISTSQSEGTLSIHSGPQLIVSAQKGSTKIKFNVDLSQFNVASLLKPGARFNVSYFISDELLPTSSSLLLTGSTDENSEEAEESLQQPATPGNVLNIQIKTEDGQTCLGQIPLSTAFPEAKATEQDLSQWTVNLTPISGSQSNDVEFSIQEKKSNVSYSEELSEDESQNSDDARSSRNSLSSSRSSSTSDMIKSIRRKESQVPTQGKKRTQNSSNKSSTTRSNEKPKSPKSKTTSITVQVKKKKSDTTRPTEKTRAAEKTKTPKYSSSSSRSSSTTSWASSTLGSLFGSSSEKND